MLLWRPPFITPITRFISLGSPWAAVSTGLRGPIFCGPAVFNSFSLIKKKDVLWYKATPIHQPAKSLQRKGTKVDLGRSQKYYIWRDGWGDKKQASTKAAPSAPSFRPNGMTSTVKKS